MTARRALYKLQTTRRLMRGFTTDRNGSIAMVTALFLPVLALLIGGTIDFAAIVHQRYVLQAATDAAALSTAKQLSLSDSTSSDFAAVGQQMVEQFVAKNTQSKGALSDVSVRTTVKQDPLEVSVAASRTVQTYFQSGFGLLPTMIQAGATARIVGSPNICLLALASNENGAVSLEQNATVKGNDCAVFSNSTHNIGIKSKSSAMLSASMICSAGGVQGGGKNFDPPPNYDCPQFDDPLASRPEPPVGACGAGPLIIDTDATLSPGTYCSGLVIEAGAHVELRAGTYVIRDGPLVVRDGGGISGNGVGFYLTGDGAVIDLEAKSSVKLEAPTTGTMAGLLFFGSRDGAKGPTHQILSENAQNLVGTIYLPTGELRIDGSAQIGAEAAYTAIVAEKIRLYGGPNIILNSRYEETEVPVPAGIKGAGQPVALVN